MKILVTEMPEKPVNCYFSTWGYASGSYECSLSHLNRIQHQVEIAYCHPDICPYLQPLNGENKNVN